MDKDEIIYTLLLEMKEDQIENGKDIAAIKEDLKHHIRRTHLLEKRTEYVVTWRQGLVILPVLISIVGLLKTLEMI